MKKKILATSYHTGGANAIIPVVKKLKEKNEADVSLMGYKNSETIFKNAGLEFKTLADYNIKNGSFESAEKILEKEKPDLILTGPSMQNKSEKEIIEHSFIHTAKQKNIPTLTVLDSWTFYAQKFSDYYEADGKYDPNSQTGKFKFLPDKIAVLDELAKNAMINLGFDEKKLIVTGNPYYDQLNEFTEKFGELERKKIREELCIDKDSNLFTYISQPIEKRRGISLGFTEKTAFKELADALEIINDKNAEKKNVLKDISLVVKTHPSEDKWNLKQAWELKETKSFGYPLSIDNDLSRHPWNVVLASDIIVSCFSTTLVEACYLDKIAISLQPGLKKEDELTFNQLGITIPIYNPGEIESVANRILEDEIYKNMLAEKRKKLYNDGKATERVIEIIETMIK